MYQLIKCVFCENTISKNELEYKDENGNWCKVCWDWLNNDCLKKWGESNANKPQ